MGANYLRSDRSKIIRAIPVPLLATLSKCKIYFRMVWILIFVPVFVLAMLIARGFITSSDIKGDLSWKQWIQVIGVVLMSSAFYDSKGPVTFHFEKWELIAGVLIFASTFLTWKRNDGDDT